jgi:hypothetical protein
MAKTFDIIIPKLFLVTITPHEEFLEWKLYSGQSKNSFTNYSVTQPTAIVHSYDVDYVCSQFFEITKNCNIVDKWDTVLIILVKMCEELWIIQILEQLSNSYNEKVVESVIFNSLTPTKTLMKIESTYPVERIRKLASETISKRLLKVDITTYTESLKDFTLFIKSTRKEFNPNHLDSLEFLEWAEKASIDELEKFSFVKPKLTLLQQLCNLFK